MKKLKIIGLLVCVILIALIVISAKNNQTNVNEDAGTRVQVKKENEDIVFNSGGSVLQYNGYIYYINTMNSNENGFSNKLCRKKLEEGAIEEVLYNAEQYKIAERLMIFNNNIFFSIIGQTFYINLDNTTYIERYNEGILYYIGNENLIFAFDGNIYKAEYYPSSLAINSIRAIATVNPQFLGEDEKNLYFYSNNNDKSKSIIGVDKEKQTAYYIDKIYSDEKEKLEIIDYTLSEKYIYMILSNAKDNGKYTIRKITKDGTKITNKEIENVPNKNIYAIKDNLYFSIENSQKMYEYNNKGEINEVEVPRKAPDIYELKLSGKNLELYKNNEFFVSVLKGIEENIEVDSIEIVGDYVYFKFYLKDIETSEQIKELIFMQVKSDGSSLLRLNDTF